MEHEKDFKAFPIHYDDIDKFSAYLEEQGYFLKDSRGKTEKTIQAPYSFGTDMKSVGEIREVGEIRNCTNLITRVLSWDSELTKVLEEY